MRLAYLTTAFALLATPIAAAPQDDDRLAKVGMMQIWLLKCTEPNNPPAEVGRYVAFITSAIDDYGEQRVKQAGAIMLKAFDEYGATKFCNMVSGGLGLRVKP
jgi:hypothetical protein